MLCSYVQTLKGRKRFLSKIKIGNRKEKAKAQRQAVNSICQVPFSLIFTSILFVSFSVEEANFMLCVSVFAFVGFCC